MKIAKVFLLISLGIFLFTRFTSGTLLFYIHQRFALLTLAAALGLMLMAAGYFFATGHSHDGHDHDHASASWLGLLIVALPVLFGLLVAPQPLGATALSNRELNTADLSSLAPPGSNAVLGAAGEGNILDWLYAFQQNPDPAAFNGQEARIVGFVYRDGRFDEDTFLVGRFIVSCCVADANPVGLVVRWPEAETLADDQWVEVSGRFEAGTFDGKPTPILVIETLTPTNPPAQPYLYL